MADDQHLGRFQLARCTLPACVHLLHCSKKHFPFSVVSLTQKTHKLTHANTHTTHRHSRPPYLSVETLAAVRIQVEGVRASLGFKMPYFSCTHFIFRLGKKGFDSFLSIKQPHTKTSSVNLTAARFWRVASFQVLRLLLTGLEVSWDATKRGMSGLSADMSFDVHYTPHSPAYAGGAVPY